jgi:hypothetical protein
LTENERKGSYDELDHHGFLFYIHFVCFGCSLWKNCSKI